MDKNKKKRYYTWLKELKDAAVKYNITITQMVHIISDIQPIRELHKWSESDEFTGYAMYRLKKKEVL